MKAKSAKGKATRRRLAREAGGSASGALAGAVAGASAGPAGAAAGAFLGGVAGAIIGAGLDAEASREAARARKLDAEIGVSEGELGAPNLEHPPAKVGAYSAASMGAGSSADVQPAEGPIPAPTS